MARLDDELTVLVAQLEIAADSDLWRPIATVLQQQLRQVATARAAEAAEMAEVYAKLRDRVDELRLMIGYMAFDLEATTRERDELRRRHPE